MSLSLSSTPYDEITSSAVAVTSFETEFKAEIAASLGIPVDRVEVSSIKPGASASETVVEFDIVPANSNTYGESARPVTDVRADLDEAIVNTTSSLYTSGTWARRTDPSTYSASVATATGTGSAANDGLSGGEIALIVVGCVVVVGVAAGGGGFAVYFVMKKNGSQKHQMHPQSRRRQHRSGGGGGGGKDLMGSWKVKRGKTVEMFSADVEKATALPVGVPVKAGATLPMATSAAAGQGEEDMAKAVATVTRAVAEDNAGQYGPALMHYEEALTIFNRAIVGAPESQRKSVEARLALYSNRAQVLRKELNRRSSRNLLKGVNLGPEKRL